MQLLGGVIRWVQILAINTFTSVLCQSPVMLWPLNCVHTIGENFQECTDTHHIIPCTMRGHGCVLVYSYIKSRWVTLLGNCAVIVFLLMWLLSRVVCCWTPSQPDSPTLWLWPEIWIHFFLNMWLGLECELKMKPRMANVLEMWTALNICLACHLYQVTGQRRREDK